MNNDNNFDPERDAEKIKNSTKKPNPIQIALRLLASMDTDHAKEGNGEGFNKDDTEVGHALAAKEVLTYEEQKTAKAMLRKYKKQLGADLYLEVINFAPSKKGNGESGGFELIETLKGMFFSNRQGLGFYVGDDGIPVEIESDAFEGLLANRKYEAGAGLPSGEEISNIRRLARYRAAKNIRDVGVRVARTKEGLVYDPAREDGQLYFITGTSCELRKPDAPYTVRYPGMLEAKVTEGTLEDHLALIELWNLTEQGKNLSMGLDFSRFIPDIPHAMEVVTGSHGAGKTSYTEIKRELFDPSGAPSQSLKFDERDLSISALHQGMLAFDNVNTVLPDYISDIICRLTTGQGFRTRELYTNMGEIILKLKRPIIMNGINRPGYKPDFIDRECPMDLGTMPEEKRLTDAEIRSRADELVPKVRGFILSIIPKALELYPEVEKELKGRLPRMADFVLWAECGMRAMGFPPMSFFSAYSETKHKEIADVAKETLVVSAIQSLMAGREIWTGTTTDLLRGLQSVVTEGQLKSNAFPRDARRLGRLLKELGPTLKELGITLDEDNSNKNERKKLLKKDHAQESPKVNVGNVGGSAGPEKSAVSKQTLDTDINFSKNSNVSTAEPGKSGIRDITDNTDIKTDNFHAEVKKDNTPEVMKKNDNREDHEVNVCMSEVSAERRKSDIQKPTLDTDITDINFSKGNTDLRKSDVQNDSNADSDSGITLHDAEALREELLKSEYYLTPECGVSSDGKRYKLGITRPSDPKKLEELEVILKEHGFVASNQGAFGTLFFARPLRRDSQ